MFIKILSEVNLFKIVITSTMELLESLAWMTLGFVPSVFAMEFAWRVSKKKVSDQIIKKELVLK